MFVVEEEAMRLPGTSVAIVGRHHRLDAGAPPAGHGVEAHTGRGGDPSRGQSLDQLRPGATGVLEVTVAGAEVEAPGVLRADREAPARAVGRCRARPWCGGAPWRSPSRPPGGAARSAEVDLPLTTSGQGEDRTPRAQAKWLPGPGFPILKRRSGPFPLETRGGCMWI